MRKGIAVLAGLIIGLVVISLVEHLGQRLFPTMLEFQSQTNTQDTIDFLAAIPANRLIFILLAYFLGAFFAGAISAIIVRQSQIALLPGMILLLLGILQVAFIPHPLWFIILSLSIYLPASYLGGIVVIKIFSKTKNLI